MKTRSWISRKIDIFAKGLTHGFGIQMAIFRTSFFLRKIGQENVFYDILERVKAYPGYENKNLKKAKNWHFFKWGSQMVLVLKWPFFELFFSGKIGPENVFYDILEGIKAYSRIWNQEVE